MTLPLTPFGQASSNPLKNLMGANQFKPTLPLGTPATPFNPEGVQPNLNPAVPKVTNTPVASPAFSNNSSVVDYLSLNKQPSDYGSRAKLATQYGIKNYAGTAEQNMSLLASLQKQATPATASPATPATPAVGVGLFNPATPVKPAMPSISETPISTPATPTVTAPPAPAIATPNTPALPSKRDELTGQLTEIQKQIIEKNRLSNLAEVSLTGGQLKVAREASERGIAMPIVRGQQEELAQQRALERQTEAIEMSALTGQEANALNQLAQYQDMTKPVTINNKIVQYNPETGAYDVLYSEPEATKQQDLMTVSPGTSIFDPNTGEFLGTAPEKPSDNKPITEKVGNTLLQWNPDTQEWSSIYTEAGAGVNKPTIMNVNGVDYQVNPDGSLSAPQVPTIVNQQKVKQAETNLQLVKDILSDNNLNAVTGIPGPSAFMPSTALVRNRLEQLKNLLSLEGREKLKGSGAISDFEARMLEKSASVLGRNLSNDDMRAVLTDLGTKFSNIVMSAGLQSTLNINGFISGSPCNIIE